MMAARLSHLLHDIAVPAGRFLIGRGTDCQLSLDDPLVSRRHAVVAVGDDGLATVADLGSRNGVFLNGVRVEKPEPLRDGDVIRIGSQDICYYDALDSRPSSAPRAARVTMQQIPMLDFSTDDGLASSPRPRFAEPPPAPPPPSSPSSPAADQPDARPRADAAPASSPAADVPPSAKPSQRGLPPSIPMPAIRELRPLEPDDPEEATTIASGAFAAARLGGGLSIIGSVADKALALGRADEAERILQRSLTDVLARAAKGDVDADMAERAASYAMRLAAGTGRGAWVDYIFQLYTALRALPPGRLVDELYAAVRKVKHTDKSVLRAYTACLKEISGGFGPAERFVQQRIEGFERWAP